MPLIFHVCLLCNKFTQSISGQRIFNYFPKSSNKNSFIVVIHYNPMKIKFMWYAFWVYYNNNDNVCQTLFYIHWIPFWVYYGNNLKREQKKNKIKIVPTWWNSFVMASHTWLSIEMESMEYDDIRCGNCGWARKNFISFKYLIKMFFLFQNTKSVWLFHSSKLHLHFEFSINLHSKPFKHCKNSSFNFKYLENWHHDIGKWSSQKLYILLNWMCEKKGLKSNDLLYIFSAEFRNFILWMDVEQRREKARPSEWNFHFFLFLFFLFGRKIYIEARYVIILDTQWIYTYRKGYV